MAGVRKHPLNLPGIDNTQPDIFETPDLPAQEEQEVFVPPEHENENIDRTVTTAKKAFDKFSDKPFSTRDKDYSEAVGKKRGKGGLLTGQQEFSIREDPADKEPETPLQKFHRLQYEVAQFIKETQALEQQQQSQTPASNLVDGSVHAQEMTQQLVILQTQLTGLLSNDSARSAIDPAHYIHHHATLQTDLSRKLISEIQSVGEAEKKGETKQGEGKSAAGVKYELYYTPDHQKYVQLNRLVDLEKRVAGLEELVGSQPVAGSGSAPATAAPLASLVGDLRDKVTLLDGPRLEALSQKIKALTPQLEAATKQGIDRPASQDKKITEMYEMMQRWDAVSAHLPALVTRLTGLRTAHEDAARASTSLAQLDHAQNAVRDLLRNHAELASQLNTSFAANMETIQGNVKHLDERFVAIQQRLEKK